MQCGWGMALKSRECAQVSLKNISASYFEPSRESISICWVNKSNQCEHKKEDAQWERTVAAAGGTEAPHHYGFPNFFSTDNKWQSHFHTSDNLEFDTFNFKVFNFLIQWLLNIFIID